MTIIVDFLAVKNKVCEYLDNVNDVTIIRLLQDFPDEDYRVVFDVLTNLEFTEAIHIDKNTIINNPLQPVPQLVAEPEPTQHKEFLDNK